jgi:beta-lactam-binding protein with PASTA domain
VIAQYPEAGNQLEKGGAIGVLVSTGKPEELYVMPRLTGKKAEEALRTIDRLGLQRRVRTRAAGGDTPAADRIVLSQKPSAGHPVSADATVELVVSR